MKDVVLFGRVSFLDKLLFTKHLSIMVKSGITLSEALEVLRFQTTNSVFKKILIGVESEVNNGQSLAKALKKYPKTFDPLYLNMVSIGEESGNLEENLDFLARELQKTYEFDKKVKSALLYPEIILSVALIMGGGISLFVLPQLASLFVSLDVVLPLPTRVLLWLSALMQNYGWVIVVTVLGLVFLFSLLVKSAFVKPVWHQFLLRLPIFGHFIQNVEAANFCRNLGLMLKSGLPIVTALEVVRDSTTNLVYRDYVRSLLLEVEKGSRIETELSNGQYKYLPLIVAKMSGVGERTGKLDETLLYLGDFFADEVDTTAKNLPTILEPLLLVIIAGMVLFLALAIIGPIYDLTGSVGQ